MTDRMSITPAENLTWDGTTWVTQDRVWFDQALVNHSKFYWLSTHERLTCNCGWTKYFRSEDPVAIEKAARKHRTKAALAELPIDIRGLREDEP